jgi:hypothetical protein
MASSDWKETVAPDEDTRFDEYAQRLATLQRKHARDGTTHRALHAKGHGIHEATFEVAGDLPEHARHGLFAKPAKYEALVRFSNAAGRVQADRVGDVRGIAVKVLGVAGDKVLGDAPTQDFLGILSSSLPVRTPDEFIALVWATRSMPLALFRLLGAFGLRAFPLVRRATKGLKTPPGSLASKRFFSAAPLQCGPHAVRFSLSPIDADAGDPQPGADAYREELAARLRRAPVSYELALQFFVDEQRTPIEDASVDWTADYVRVATLVIARQDAASERGVRLAERGERLAFDPWHALVAHKPLGAIMRARKHAYFASEQGRGAQPDPASIAELLR